MTKILLMVLAGMALLLMAAAARIGHLEKRYQQAKQTGDTYRVTLNTIQNRQISLTQLDQQKTRQLQKAYDEIEQLQRDIVRGAKRVRVHATCNTTAATTAPGMDDAAGARLTADAEQNYIYLRRQIAGVTAQITGLQDYITRVCIPPELAHGG